MYGRRFPREGLTLSRQRRSTFQRAVRYVRDVAGHSKHITRSLRYVTLV
jgi:hypothetical protein